MGEVIAIRVEPGMAPPAALPGGFQLARSTMRLDGVHGITGQEALYLGGDHLAVVTQTRVDGTTPYPEGEHRQVNSHTAILQTGLSGVIEASPPPPAGAFSPEPSSGAEPGARLSRAIESEVGQPIPYREASRLTWRVGDVQIELLSTLPEVDLLRLAEALTVWNNS